MFFYSEKKTLVLRCASVVVAIILSTSGAGWGAAVNIEITGWVTHIYDDAGVLEGQINVDDIVTGWYRYDSSTPDTNPSIAIGDYKYNTPPFGVSLNIGGLLFASDPQNLDFLIQVRNDYNSEDIYLLSSTNNLPILNDVTVAPIRWLLEDDTCTALNSDALPLTAPTWAGWCSGNTLSITCRSGSQAARIEGTMTDAQLVPEPASAFIMAFGATIIGLRRRNVRL